MKERIESSFKNATPYHQIFSLLIGLGVPIICFLYIGWYYSTTDNPDSGDIIFPLVFGIVSPVVMLKDIFSKEVITITNKGVSHKKGSKGTKIPYHDIDTVFSVYIRERVGLDFGDRSILFIHGKNKQESIACGNLFSDEDKNYLLETLQHYEPDNDYEIVHTENISEVFSYLRNGEGGKKVQSPRPAQKGLDCTPVLRQVVKQFCLFSFIKLSPPQIHLVGGIRLTSEDVFRCRLVQ